MASCGELPCESYTDADTECALTLLFFSEGNTNNAHAAMSHGPRPLQPPNNTCGALSVEDSAAFVYRTVQRDHSYACVPDADSLPVNPDFYKLLERVEKRSDLSISDSFPKDKHIYKIPIHSKPFDPNVIAQKRRKLDFDNPDGEYCKNHNLLLTCLKGSSNEKHDKLAIESWKKSLSSRIPGPGQPISKANGFKEPYKVRCQDGSIAPKCVKQKLNMESPKASVGIWEEDEANNEGYSRSSINEHFMHLLTNDDQMLKETKRKDVEMDFPLPIGESALESNPSKDDVITCDICFAFVPRSKLSIHVALRHFSIVSGTGYPSPIEIPVTTALASTAAVSLMASSLLDARISPTYMLKRYLIDSDISVLANDFQENPYSQDIVPCDTDSELSLNSTLAQASDIEVSPAACGDVPPHSRKLKKAKGILDEEILFNKSVEEVKEDLQQALQCRGYINLGDTQHISLSPKLSRHSSDK